MKDRKAGEAAAISIWAYKPLPLSPSLPSSPFIHKVNANTDFELLLCLYLFSGPFYPKFGACVRLKRVNESQCFVWTVACDKAASRPSLVIPWATPLLWRPIDSSSSVQTSISWACSVWLAYFPCHQLTRYFRRSWFKLGTWKTRRNLCTLPITPIQFPHPKYPFHSGHTYRHSQNIQHSNPCTLKETRPKAHWKYLARVIMDFTKS